MHPRGEGRISVTRSVSRGVPIPTTGVRMSLWSADTCSCLWEFWLRPLLSLSVHPLDMCISRAVVTFGRHYPETFPRLLFILFGLQQWVSLRQDNPAQAQHLPIHYGIAVSNPKPMIQENLDVEGSQCRERHAEGWCGVQGPSFRSKEKVVNLSAYEIGGIRRKRGMAKELVLSSSETVESDCERHALGISPSPPFFRSIWSASERLIRTCMARCGVPSQIPRHNPNAGKRGRHKPSIREGLGR